MPSNARSSLYDMHGIFTMQCAAFLKTTHTPSTARKPDHEANILEQIKTKYKKLHTHVRRQNPPTLVKQPNIKMGIRAKTIRKFGKNQIPSYTNIIANNPLKHPLACTNHGVNEKSDPSICRNFILDFKSNTKLLLRKNSVHYIIGSTEDQKKAHTRKANCAPLNQISILLNRHYMKIGNSSTSRHCRIYSSFPYYNTERTQKKEKAATSIYVKGISPEEAKKHIRGSLVEKCEGDEIIGTEDSNVVHTMHHKKLIVDSQSRNSLVVNNLMSGECNSTKGISRISVRKKCDRNCI